MRGLSLPKRWVMVNLVGWSELIWTARLKPLSSRHSFILCMEPFWTKVPKACFLGYPSSRTEGLSLEIFHQFHHTSSLGNVWDSWNIWSHSEGELKAVCLYYKRCHAEVAILPQAIFSHLTTLWQNIKQCHKCLEWHFHRNMLPGLSYL